MLSNFCFLHSFFSFSFAIVACIICIHRLSIRRIYQYQDFLSLSYRHTKSVRQFFCHIVVYLAIVRDVVEIYGGTISLEESEDLGGLLARLRLPLAE